RCRLRPRPGSACTGLGRPVLPDADLFPHFPLGLGARESRAGGDVSRAAARTSARGAHPGLQPARHGYRRRIRCLCAPSRDEAEARGMTFEMIHLWWWPYVFITVGGALATAPFRFLGVYLGGRISESSDALVFVRAMATALVAAVIANLIVFP